MQLRAVASILTFLCASVLVSVPVANASQASQTIYYSGLGEAGAGSGKEGGAYVMAHERNEKNYETWRGTSKCNSNRAVPRNTKRRFSRLVGYSVGRLGPAYYLQQMEQKRKVSSIRSVILLDPGPKDEMECDIKSGAGQTYATWLRQNGANRLLIVTADSSAAKRYSGIREVYLAKLGPDLASRVLVCEAKTLHDKIDNEYKWLIGAKTQQGCPRGTSLNRYSPTTQTPPTTNQPLGSGPPAAASPVVSLSQGPPAPHGYRYAISLSGFAANSSINVTCFDSVSPGGFYNFVLTTDGAGNASSAAYCYSADGPDHWVVAGGVESNRVSWSGSPPPAPNPPAPTPTWNEQQGSLGANTFTNPYNASGMGPKIHAMSWVAVSCKVYAPQIVSANPDGYWYRIASAPWNNAYYAVANTFWNGDVPGQKPYTHNTDFAVPNC